MKNLQSTLFFSGARTRATFSASLLIWAAAAMTPSIASADIMFSNFGPGHTYQGDQGNVLGSGFAQGDTFVAPETGALTSILVALSCFDCTTPTDFTISLDKDSGTDSPGTTIESFHLTGVTLGAFPNTNSPVKVTSVLMPLLTVGTRYWVTVSSISLLGWNLNSTGDMSDEADSTDGGASWFSPSGSTPGAFEVDATPEPASLLLLGTLLSGLALRKRLSRD